MRKGGGKAKGANFERSVCKSLSLWVSHDKHEDVFWRSAMSGGRSTVAHTKGKRLAQQAGDITCIHPVGQPFANKFLMECKNYRDLQYYGLLSSKGNLVKFWLEVRRQARRYGKMPLMVAKQNQQPATVCLTRDGAKLLKVCPVVTAPKLNLRIVLLDEFLRTAIRVPNDTDNRSSRVQ